MNEQRQGLRYRSRYHYYACRRDGEIESIAVTCVYQGMRFLMGNGAQSARRFLSYTQKSAEFKLQIYHTRPLLKFAEIGPYLSRRAAMVHRQPWVRRSLKATEQYAGEAPKQGSGGWAIKNYPSSSFPDNLGIARQQALVMVWA